MSPSLTIYHDGSCPLCQREIAFFRRRLEAQQEVQFTDVAAPEWRAAPDLTREQAMARFHVRDQDGNLLSGARAFIRLWRQTPGLRWAGWLATVPPLPWVLERAYRGFLKMRPWVQRRLGGATAPSCEAGACQRGSTSSSH